MKNSIESQINIDFFYSGIDRNRVTKFLRKSILLNPPKANDLFINEETLKLLIQKNNVLC